MKDNIDILQINKKKICFIMAHHDDETLFFGGLLNNLNSTNEITIVVIVNITEENTNYNYIKKLKNFKNIINLLNIKYVELNLMNIKIQTVFCDKITSLGDNITQYKNLLNKLNDYISYLSQQEKKEEIKKVKIKKEKVLINKFQLINELKSLRAKRITYIQELEIDKEKHKEDILNIKNRLEKLNLKEFDLFFTHNKYGEYGNYQHKIVYEVVKDLKQTILSDKLVFTTTNTETNLYISVNKSLKQKLLKMYDFKDTDERMNIWVDQCLANYTFWADNDYEYFEIIE